MRNVRFLAFAFAAAALAMFAESADARGSWGSWGSSGGSRGYASSGGSSGGSSGWYSRGGSSGGYSRGGSSGGYSRGGSSGWRRGFRARRVARRYGSWGGSYGSSGGSYGSSGGSYGSSGGYTTYYASSHSSGGSSGGYTSYAGRVVYGVPMATTTYESPVIGSVINSGTPIYNGAVSSVPLEGTTLQGGSLGTGTVIDSAPINATPRQEVAKPAVPEVEAEPAAPAVEADSAMLRVAVPSDAVVTVNGHQTTSGGEVRKFMSRGLKNGYIYTFVVKATFDVGGQAKSETKSVKLRGGDLEQLTFEAPVQEVIPEPKSEDLVTVVRLHVPAQAQVTLSGNATNGTGSIRTFRTTQLKPGQQWAGYTVRVTAVVNGQTLSQERSIDVKSGSTNDLTFTFADGSIVSR